MDSTRQQQSLASACRGVPAFPHRPWMNETGLAAAANSGHLGLKGIIAGNVIAFLSLLHYIPLFLPLL